MLGWTPVNSDIPRPQGISLFEVQNSLHLLMVIHDALMGIMTLTEAGKIHCDISAFNLLLVNPEKHYKDQDWLKAPKTWPNPAVWDWTAKDTNDTSDNAISSTSAQDEERVCPRLARAKELKRGPVCVVHDMTSTLDEDRLAGTAHTDWTGTPAFISGQLLLGYAPGDDKPPRTFIHDVESLFWVLVWVVAYRSQGEDTWQVSKEAEALMRKLSQSDLSELGDYKRKTLSDVEDLDRLVRGFGNDLCEDLAPIIGELAEFLFIYIYVNPAVPGLTGYRKLRAQSHEEYTSDSQGNTFTYLFGLLDGTIAELQAKHLKIDFSQL
ncbi:hypothetical protein FRC12_016299 [Ceratobasidium sp. 428]|nr:hypothetical protein FRC09_009211 [Ceratobasidium sp. 395]KAG8739434.1 hypothetical protein FRC12_016299 [Ceratobasidium sp. 428]